MLCYVRKPKQKHTRAERYKQKLLPILVVHKNGNGYLCMCLCECVCFK